MAHGVAGGEGRGKNRDFDEACKEAYENAKQATGSTGPFTIEIQLEGTNPFSDYVIVARPTS